MFINTIFPNVTLKTKIKIKEKGTKKFMKIIYGEINDVSYAHLFTSRVLNKNVTL